MLFSSFADAGKATSSERTELSQKKRKKVWIVEVVKLVEISGSVSKFRKSHKRARKTFFEWGKVLGNFSMTQTVIKYVWNFHIIISPQQRQRQQKKKNVKSRQDRNVKTCQSDKHLRAFLFVEEFWRQKLIRKNVFLCCCAAFIFLQRVVNV